MFKEASQDSKNSSTTYWKLIVILLLFNLALYACFHNKLAIPTDTEYSYSRSAINLLSGHGLTTFGQLHTKHPPLFSLFLACIYFLTGVWGTTNPYYPLVGILNQTLTCGFIFLTGREWFGEKAGAWAAVLFIIYPMYAVLTATRYVWSATSFLTLIFIIFFYCFVRGLKTNQLSAKKKWMFASGFALGLATLTWAGVMLLCALMSGAYCMLNKKNVKVSILILFLAASTFPELVWSYYVYQKTGEKMWGSTATTLSVGDGIFHMNHEGSKLLQFKFAQEALRRSKDGRLNTRSDIVHLYADEFAQHPGEVVRFLLYKTIRPWYGTDSEKHEQFVAVIQIIYLSFTIIGIVFAMRQCPRETLMCVSIICYFWGIALVGLSIVRYMIPAMSIAVIFAGHALDRVITNISRQRAA